MRTSNKDGMPVHPREWRPHIRRRGKRGMRSSVMNFIIGLLVAGLLILAMGFDPVLFFLE